MRQRILDPLESANVEIGDAVEEGVTIVQPRTHAEAGNGIDEITVILARLMPWDLSSFAICGVVPESGASGFVELSISR